tara:strand:+ start:86 stop:235 length:150 start_codon:yes stop_codon:yes gene_type:complete
MIKKIIAKIKSIFASSSKEEEEIDCEHTRVNSVKKLERFCLDCGKHLIV